jgi:hypothetical protein
MNAFLEQLGARIADRWLVNLLLPGLFWLCCAAVAAQLGWAHALDPVAARPLVRWLAGQRSAAQVLLLVAGVAAGSAVVGLAASGLATMLRRAWTMPGRTAPARWLRQWRRRRWDAADRVVVRYRRDLLATVVGAATVAPDYGAALARRDSIGREPPERPTWIGDRWLATGIRIHRAYGLDLTVVWPRLWAVLPDTVRADVGAVHLAYQESSAVVSWAICYGVVGLFWGPALIIAAVLAVIGVLRAREATAHLCELVESSCDLYRHALAERLRVPDPGGNVREIGRQLTAQLRRKDLPPQ